MLRRWTRPLFFLLAAGVIPASGQTVVFNSQVFQSNGATGFSPSFVVWDDLQTSFGGLSSAGTLSEISVVAVRSGGPNQSASGFIDLRLFNEAGNQPQGVSIAQIPFNDSFGAAPNDPFGSSTLIRLDGLESLNLTIPQNARLGAGVFFDDDSWSVVHSDASTIGSSPGGSWVGDFPNERNDGGIGDYAWRVVVAETSPTVTWLSQAGGEWDDPNGWSTGFTPGPTQDVDALMITGGLGPLIGPGVDTAVKSLDFRSFAADTIFRMQPGVELVGTERAWFQGRSMLEVNGGVLRTANFFGTISEFDSGLIEVTNGPFQPQRGDFLLSGSGDPTIQLRGANFDVDSQGFVPAELQIGDSEGHRGTFEATDGTTLSAERVLVGRGVGSGGTLRLAGAGTTATVNSDVTLGASSLAGGELVVEDSATLNAGRLVIGQFGVGDATIRGGTVNVITDPLVTDSGDVEIGGVPGAGLSESHLRIEQGGVLNADGFVSVVDFSAGAGAGVTVTGSGSQLNAAAGVGVGSNRRGFLHVVDGATLTGGTVRTGAGGNLPMGEVNEVLISGGQTTADVSSFALSARGRLTIENGATASGNLFNFGGEAIITGPGTVLDARVTQSTFSSFSVANGSTRIEDGAVVRSAGFDAGGFSGVQSTAIVSGAGSRLESAGLFFVVGVQSRGTLEIRDGGVVDRTGDIILNASDTAEGDILVTGDHSRLDVDGAIYLSGGRVGAEVLDAPLPATVRIESGATVTATGVVEPFTNGTVELAGGTLVASELTLASGGAFAFSDGRLSVDAFTGDLVNDGLGTLAPGTSPGVTAVSGAYTQGPQATLEIELFDGGLNPTHDQLTAGTAVIDGVLSLLAQNPESLSPGDSFVVLSTTGGRTGVFREVEGRFLGAGLAADLDYTDSAAVSVDIVRATDLLTGDFNGDGGVDIADYTVWRDSFGQAGAGLIADADNSGMIDNGDYLLWLDNFGAVFSEPSAVAVPEPTALASVGVLVGLLAGRRSRR